MIGRNFKESWMALTFLFLLGCSQSEQSQKGSTTQSVAASPVKEKYVFSDGTEFENHPAFTEVTFTDFRFFNCTRNCDLDDGYDEYERCENSAPKLNENVFLAIASTTEQGMMTPAFGSHPSEPGWQAFLFSQGDTAYAETRGDTYHFASALIDRTDMKLVLDSERRSRDFPFYSCTISDRESIDRAMAEQIKGYESMLEERKF